MRTILSPYVLLPLVMLLTFACSSPSTSPKHGATDIVPGFDSNASGSDTALYSDCVFDNSTQTDAFMERFPQFANYTWNDELKEARIPLGSGDTLIIKRGGCVHFGYYGTLVLRSDTTAADTNNYWFSKATRLAETLFEKPDFLLFDSLLSARAYDVLESAGLFYFSFRQDRYCDMSITLDFSHRAWGVTIVEVGFYLC